MKDCSFLRVNIFQKPSVYTLSVLVLFALFLGVQTTFLPQMSVYGRPLFRDDMPSRVRSSLSQPNRTYASA